MSYSLVFIIGIVVGIIIMWTNTFNLFESNSESEKGLKLKYKTETIKILVRQAARWATASLQDNNSMIAVLHANYGAGYLWALFDIATTSEIEKVTNIDILKFRGAIIDAQDNATKKMAQLCPSYAPELSYLSKIAAEG